MQTFDFEYEHPSGVLVVVEVDYEWDEPCAISPNSAASDWDYYGGLIVDGIRIYSGIDEIQGLEISPGEIAKQFKQYMENIEMLYAMQENEYF